MSDQDTASGLIEITGDDLALIMRMGTALLKQTNDVAISEIERGHLDHASALVVASEPLAVLLNKVETIIDGGQTVVVTPF